MTALKKGLIVALVQMSLVVLVGAKLVVDRWRYPEVWVETAPYDPNLPLRGRYVRLLAVVEAPGLRGPGLYGRQVRLEVRGDRLLAVPDEAGPVTIGRGSCGGQDCVTLSEPLAFFIPEGVADPSVRPQGEELWVRVSVPPRGAPRPVELGVRSGGEIRPLRVGR